MSSIEPKVIFSIDFGTHGFQSAYARVGNVKDAQVIAAWPKPPGGKVLNAILLNGIDKSVTAFGWEARDRYLEAMEEKKVELKEMEYHENFKLQLLQHEETHFDAGKEIKAANEEFSCTLGTLITKCLREIKNGTLSYYRKNVNKALADCECMWILTVPVAWTEQSREVMKLCCEEVGIARENVLIETEPQAAGNFFIWGTDIGKEKKAGFKFIVLDCGSGTFDVVAQRVVENEHGTRQLEDIHHADGKVCGALNVDDAFFSQVLARVFGERVVERFKTECPADCVDQRKKFQGAREKVRPNDKSKSVKISRALIQMANEEGVDFAENARSFAIDGKTGVLDFRTGFSQSLVIHHDVWQMLHDPVIENIVEKTQDLLMSDGLDDVDLLYLVGGFSQSHFVREGIKTLLEDDFHESIECVPCDRAQIAVSLGALWAADKKVIGRKLHASYGIEIDREYRPGSREDEERKVPDPHSRNGYKIARCFDTLWVKGEDYEAGSRKERFFLLHPGQKDVEISLYQSDDDVTHYVDEECCTHGATWTYEIDPGMVSAQEQKLCVQFEFGEDCLRCELHVQNASGVDSRVRRFQMKLDPKFEGRDR